MVEWAQVAPGTVLVATAEQAWLHHPGPFDPFAAPMTAAGSRASTQRLLDAAIAVFQHERLQQPAPPLTVEGYVERVLACYHGGHATPRLLRRAAERFRSADRPELARWALDTARDEDHDHLALADLAALGYPPDTVALMPCPSTMAAGIEYFARCIEGANPVSCVGYIYALERPSSLIQASYIEAIEALLGPDIEATRCLRWHSSLGDEAAHAERRLDLIAGLPAEDRIAITRAVYETARIFFGDAGSPQPSNVLREESHA